MKFSTIYLVHGESLFPLLENSIKSLRNASYDAAITLFSTNHTHEKLVEIAKIFKCEIKNLSIEGVSGNEDYTQIASDNFRRVTKMKWKIIKDTLSEGYDIVTFSDCDIYYHRDFRPYIATAGKNFPIGSQIDATNSFPPNRCSGFMYFCNVNEIGKLLDHFYKQDHNIRSEDQAVFNNVLNNSPSIMNAYFPLPQFLFQCGLLHGIAADPRLPMVRGELEPYMFHANFTVGLEDKIRLLKHLGFWKV